jgi:Zn-dependent peptidase ImmA (M78 family)
MKRWPALPKRVDGLAGPITVTVRRVESFQAADGDHCWGLYKPESRRIILAGKIPPALRWHTLAHEWAHAWILDAGLPNLIHGHGPEKDRNIEVFADTLASAFVRTLVRIRGMDPWEKA